MRLGHRRAACAVARCAGAPPQCLCFADRLPASCRADSFPSRAECSRVVQGVVVNHHHFIVILFGDGESRSVPIDLMGRKSQKVPSAPTSGTGAEERLLRGFVFKCDHEELVVAVRIGELDAAVHVELQWRREHRDPGLISMPSSV